MASATSSSISVKPRALWRDIAGESREDAPGVARVGDGQVHLAHRGVGRLAHRLLDGEGEAAFLRVEVRGGRGREDVARSELCDAIFRGPSCQQALAHLDAQEGGLALSIEETVSETPNPT